MPPAARLLRPAPLAFALACACAASSPGPAAAMPAATPYAHPRYALRLEARRAPRTAPAPRTSAPRGATLPVTSCLDDDGPGTLRSVLAGAAEGDVIDLSQLACSTITLTQGAIDTSALGEHPLYDVTLQGPGRDALTISAGGASQVFVIGGFSSSLGTFTVNDLGIADGRYGGSLAACILGFGGALVLNRVDVSNCHSSGTYQLVFGGAVDANTLVMTDSTITGSSLTATGANSTGAGGGAYAGDATLVRSTISGNSVIAPHAYREGYASVGGGLYAHGRLTMVDSTISGNSIEATLAGQDANGGGVYVRGLTAISGSTIDGNAADGEGGGIYKAVFSIFGDPPPPQDTRLEILDSTVSGNSATRGGGIASTRPLRLWSSTVTANLAEAGGGGVMFRLDGIYDSEGTLDLASSIVAANASGATPAHAADIGADGPVTVSGSHSLVQAADAAITLPADTLAADPGLFPLAWNGGPTRTHALSATSPALDAGSNVAELQHDQRGANFARVSGAAADIGAFEVQQPPSGDDTIFADGFDGAMKPVEVEHAYDDGDGDTNQGPPSSFDPDMLWGNYYFTAAPGGEIITRIRIAFGPTFPSLANGPVTFWLLEDDDDDGDPRNAHAVASVTGTPDVFNDTFYEVELPPTWVHGGFFVGASAKLDGGADRPARVDTGASGHDSWFFYAPDIAATIDDLAAAPFGTRNDNPAYVVLPGAFMVRATGTTVP